MIINGRRTGASSVTTRPESRPTGIAIIGCGYWGMNYVRVFSEMPDARVVAVCDPRESRLEEILRRYPDVLAATDVEDILGLDSIEAVVISTNADTHYELTRRALAAGKHVLVEKPLTTRSEESEELIELREALDLHLLVGHTFLYNRGVRKVKEYVDANTVYYLYARRTSLGPIRTDVNAPWDLAPHDVAIFNFLLDSKPELVSAVGAKVLRNHREDVGFISLTYPGGIVGHIHVSWADPNKTREVVVVCRDQRIVFNDLDPLERVRVFDKGVLAEPLDEPLSFGEYAFQLRDGDITSPAIPVNEPLKHQSGHFLHCIRRGEIPFTDAAQGLAVVRVMEAIDKSFARGGAPIPIDWSTPRSPRPRIPFVDLDAQRAAIGHEVSAAIQGCLDRSDWILGESVSAFEEEFAAYCETSAAVGTDSGLSALELTLRALGIGPGDEVVTAANSFVATALAIAAAGATPVLVDADEETGNLDPSRLEAAIGPQTKAIIPVHLYGQPADIDPILATAGQKGLAVIEDACQAHGARYKGRRAGSLGHAAAFSFYPSKNLGGYGDGGAVTTSDEQLLDRLRLLRNYGQREKYLHEVQGFNRRLDTLQAAVLRVKLHHLDAWNQERREHAALYDELLAELGCVTPVVAPWAEHVWHLYTVRVDERDALREFLAERGIDTGIHYPLPIHLQPSFRSLGYAHGDFPVAESLAEGTLSLPMYPELKEAQIRLVVDAIGEFLETRARRRRPTRSVTGQPARRREPAGDPSPAT
jgi:dTDP-4-amino-4,6-dideoxygalactose transaminase/predicted dehydrogenase